MKFIKKINLFVLVLVISSFTLSCSSDDNGGGGGGNAAEGTIKAKVDGSSMETAKQATSAGLSHGSLTILGSTMSMPSKTITLMVNGFEGEGVYKISADDIMFSAATYTEIDANFETNSWLAPYEGSGEAGEIVITEATSTHVKGTFHFKARHQENNSSYKNITQGAFNVKLD